MNYETKLNQKSLLFLQLFSFVWVQIVFFMNYYM